MTDPIKHVVVLVLENHSFDQMLGSLQQVYPHLDGVDPNVPRWNLDEAGTRIVQAETRETQMLHDPHHEHVDVVEQLADGNGGFVHNFVKTYPGVGLKEKQAIMGYYPLDFLPGLHPLARSFRICDHWFSSLPGPTWPNRMFALSGTSMGSVKMPSGPHDLAMTRNQTQDTIFDRLSEAARTWRVFFYDFPTSLLLAHQREPDRARFYSQVDTFFEMASGPEDHFPDFAVIEPKYYGLDQNDDHPPHNVMKAQKLIADTYNAVRSNRALWESTLLIVFYDEHGGFYDHVVPTSAIPPDDYAQEGYDFKRYGVRVPALLISPWLDPGVEKTEFDHTSVLRYLSDKWSLRPLTRRVEMANSIIQGPWLATPRLDTPGFIRVKNSLLIPTHPEWELADVSGHHDALQSLAAVLLNEAEASFGEKAMLALLRAWSAGCSWLGSRLVTLGQRILGRPITERRERLARAAGRIVAQK
jgi:phospholipase C